MLQTAPTVEVVHKSLHVSLDARDKDGFGPRLSARLMVRGFQCSWGFIGFRVSNSLYTWGL